MRSRNITRDLAARVVKSAFAGQAIGYGYSNTAELAAITDAWRSWSAQPDGWFVVLDGEILAHA